MGDRKWDERVMNIYLYKMIEEIYEKLGPWREGENMKEIQQKQLERTLDRKGKIKKSLLKM